MDKVHVYIEEHQRLYGNMSRRELLEHAAVGADYYPPAHISMRGVAIPAAGNSAPKSLRNGWTTVTMTTLADQTNDNTGISRNALYRNAPACSNPAS